jgi:hypothetical protein
MAEDDGFVRGKGMAYMCYELGSQDELPKKLDCLGNSFFVTVWLLWNIF